MKGSEFLRLVKRVGRQRHIGVYLDQQRGKGSHGVLFYGERKTTLKDLRKEIGSGLLNSMLHDLGLSVDDLYGRR